MISRHVWTKGITEDSGADFFHSYTSYCCQKLLWIKHHRERGQFRKNYWAFAVLIVFPGLSTRDEFASAKDGPILFDQWYYYAYRYMHGISRRKPDGAQIWHEARDQSPDINSTDPSLFRSAPVNPWYIIERAWYTLWWYYDGRP